MKYVARSSVENGAGYWKHAEKGKVEKVLLENRKRGRLGKYNRTLWQY